MKKTLVLAAAAAAMLATPALAQDGSYAQVNLGGVVAGTVDADFDITSVGSAAGEADLEVGLFASAAAGVRTSNGFAYEAEVLYFNTDIDTGELDAALGEDLNASVNSYAVMANVLYNFEAGSFSPYVGAGIGYGKTEFEMLDGSEDDAGLAYQLRAGVTVPMSDSITWDIGYRYLMAPTFEVSNADASIEADTSAHIVSVGARFAF